MHTASRKFAERQPPAFYLLFCSGMSCIEDKTVFLAECLQLLIRRLNAHQSAIILSEQKVRAFPLAAHVDDEPSCSALNFLISSTTSCGIFTLRTERCVFGWPMCIPLVLVIFCTLDDIDDPCLKVNIFPFKPRYLTLAHIHGCGYIDKQLLFRLGRILFNSIKQSLNFILTVYLFLSFFHSRISKVSAWVFNVHSRADSVSEYIGNKADIVSHCFDRNRLARFGVSISQKAVNEILNNTSGYFIHFEMPKGRDRPCYHALVVVFLEVVCEVIFLHEPSE